MRIRLPNGTVVEKTGNLGDTFWEGPVTHEVENVSGTAARSLIIEFKQPQGRR